MLPLWLCIPFAGLLLCIAIMPLVKAEWWESHQIHAVIFWSLLFIIPYAVTKGASTAAETVLECIINDYLSFIILLFGLFCVAGNISVDGDLVGSPRVNTITLLIGTFLSSLIGTTGASMLLVRPLIKMNSWRHRRSHIMIFFIFLISNMGGCLTPKITKRKPLYKDFLNLLMRKMGLEPTRCCHRQILSLLRLPFRHFRITIK
jgi:Na+/H+ antiporter NhaD/arsenite permease-like protein